MHLKPIRIGTRGSKLALWQAQWVAQQLSLRGIDAETIVISTTGDASNVPLGTIGGQGVFTKEIQRELLAGSIDLAVHSLKDLPTQPTPRIVLAAVPGRETTQDCLISRYGLKFQQLPRGAKIGTNSARRSAQLLAWRDDVQIADIRGNIDSRLRKLEEGQFDAIVLAAAGLTRLKLLSYVTEHLPQDRMMPAVGQGALGLECRSDDEPTRSAVSGLDDPCSHACVLAERELLRSLQAGCLAPVAALATVFNEELELAGRVLSLNGRQILEGRVRGRMAVAASLGHKLAADLLDQGAARLIATQRTNQC